jgi:hypothetical protein
MSAVRHWQQGTYFPVMIAAGFRCVGLHLRLLLSLRSRPV